MLPHYQYSYNVPGSRSGIKICRVIFLLVIILTRRPCLRLTLRSTCTVFDLEMATYSVKSISLPCAAAAGAATGRSMLAGGCTTPAGGSSGGGSVNTGAGIVGGGAAGAGTARGLDERDRASSHFAALILSAKAWISWKFFLPLHHLKYAPDALCLQNVLSQVSHLSLIHI